jgi:hypothetical protein
MSKERLQIRCRDDMAAQKFMPCLPLNDASRRNLLSSSHFPQIFQDEIPMPGASQLERSIRLAALVLGMRFLPKRGTANLKVVMSFTIRRFR